MEDEHYQKQFIPTQPVKIIWSKHDVAYISIIGTIIIGMNYIFFILTNALMRNLYK